MSAKILVNNNGPQGGLCPPRTMVDAVLLNAPVLPVAITTAVISDVPSQLPRDGPVHSKSLAETRKKVQMCLDVLVTLYSLFGFRKDGYKTSPSVDHWMRLCTAVGGEFSWIKVAKYKIAAFFSGQLGLALPPKPWVEGTAVDNPRILLSGIAYRWSRALMHSDEEVKLQFITSVLYSKKGFPRPGKKYTQLAERETIEKLFLQAPPQPLQNRPFCVEDRVNNYPFSRLNSVDVRSPFHAPVGNEDFPPNTPEWRIRRANAAQWENYLIEDPNARMRLELIRTVDELFEGQRLTLVDLYRPTFPSTSANYVRSRMNAGSVGEIMSHPSLLQGLTGTVDLAVDLKRSFDERTNTWNESEVLRANSEKLDDDYEILYKRAVDLAFLEDPLIRAVGLEEPLKARVITAGPPLTMFVMKPFQKITHTVLKRNPCFSLIAEPVSEKYLLDRLGRSLADDEKYLSGDYSDATNSMYSWVSNVIADRVCDHILRDLEGDIVTRDMTAKLRLMYRRSLTGHEYASEEAKHNTIHEQVHGQLMGSVTSFPVLCIANAALCRSAVELGNRRRYTLSECPLMANGDDCLMKTTEVGHAAWGFFGPYLGLKPSYGKYYWDSRILNVNSQGFERVQPYVFNDIRRETIGGMPVVFERFNVFKMTRYINLGLLFGMKRASGGGKEKQEPEPAKYFAGLSKKKKAEWSKKLEGNSVDISSAYDKYDSLGSRSWELKALTPPQLWRAVYAEFMIRTKIVLGRGKIFVPWYVPTAFGGLGIVPPEEGISILDRQVCLKMVNDPHCGFGKAVVPAETWNVHKVVMGEIPIKTTNGLRSDPMTESERDSWDKLYGRLCVGLLFSKKLETLFTQNPMQDFAKVLRHNERHWKKVKNNGNLPGRALAMTFDPYVYGKDMCSYVQCTLNPVGVVEVPGIGMLVDQQLLDSNIPPNSIIRNY